MIIEQALEFAKEKHKNQYRKFSKDPYVKHLTNTADIVKNNHGDEELITVAILHDTIEETNATEEKIKKLFGEKIASLVKQLTTNETEKNKVGKEKYLAKKLSDDKRVSDPALFIKLADRLDNVSDLKNTNEEFENRYKKETIHILESLEKNRTLSKLHKKLIDDIRRKIND